MKNTYTVYNKDGKLIVKGTADKCADKLQMKKVNFYSIYAAARKGRSKKYKIVCDNPVVRTHQKWEQYEIEFLRQNATTMTVGEMSKKLCRPFEGVRQKCSDYKISCFSIRPEDRKPRKVYQSSKKDSICWDCKNCYNGCSWSKSFEPVENRKAKKTKLGYLVLECPLFERG